MTASTRKLLEWARRAGGLPRVQLSLINCWNQATRAVVPCEPRRRKAWDDLAVADRRLRPVGGGEHAADGGILLVPAVVVAKVTSLTSLAAAAAAVAA